MTEGLPTVKKCPFCGGQPKIEGGMYMWIQCDKCGAHQFAGTDLKKVIESWNDRTEEDYDDGK